MRAYYVADVSLERHPTAGNVARVLKVKMMSSYSAEAIFTADLYGYEKPSELRWLPDPHNVGYSTGRQILDEVAQSLVEKIGRDGALNWNVEDLDRHTAEFELLWKEKALRDALRAYGITGRLTLEQAATVLQEHYVVEPIMES